MAFEDLFGLPREKGKENVKIARLQGIREAYLMLTGDYDFRGGYDPVRAMLATTADFTGLVKNALNKIIIASFETVGRAGYDWWKAIVKVEHFNTLNDITGTLVGTIASLPSVSEQAEYTELAVGDSPETASFTKYGGYIPLTLEAIDRDETRKLLQYAVELGNAAMRNISEQIAAIFTANSHAGAAHGRRRRIIQCHCSHQLGRTCQPAYHSPGHGLHRLDSCSHCSLEPAFAGQERSRLLWHR